MGRKVIEMTDDEKKLFNEIKKDIAKANARIRSIESLGVKDGFAIKQLRSYLGASTIKAITPSGFVTVRKSNNLQQLLGIQKALEDFIGGVSTKRDVEELRKRYEAELGKKLSIKYTETIYQLENNYEWIYEYIPKSEFWDEWAPLTKELDSKTWIEQIYLRAPEIKDNELKKKVEALYIYCKGE